MSHSVSRGTTWAQPCPAAPDGVHYYRRPVVSVGFLNDLRARAADVIAAAERDWPHDWKLIERLKELVDVRP